MGGWVDGWMGGCGRILGCLRLFFVRLFSSYRRIIDLLIALLYALLLSWCRIEPN
jgi:hypothetical protein